MPLWLLPAFALTAILYAMAGFGGGSTYTALLAAAEIDYRILPIISLSCNIIVVTGGVWRFLTAGHLPWQQAAPIILLSVPAAWAGGRVPVSETLFLGLLGGALFISALIMFRSERGIRRHLSNTITRFIPFAGAGIGFLSGMVGIGGGIFLAPMLHLIAWDTPKKIAGTAALFILVNSSAGVLGQLMKGEGAGTLSASADFWPLLLAVLIGGQVGSRLGAQIVSETLVRRVTALLILIVAIRLIIRMVTG